MKIFKHIFLFSLLFAASGCYTYNFLIEEPEAYIIKKDETVKIDSLLMKNGAVISLTGFDVIYQKLYKGYNNVFVCTTAKDKRANELFYVEKNKVEKIIPINEINKIFAEKRKSNTLGTVILVTFLSLTVLVALFLILMGLAFSNMRIG